MNVSFLGRKSARVIYFWKIAINEELKQAIPEKIFKRNTYFRNLSVTEYIFLLVHKLTRIEWMIVIIDS